MALVERLGGESLVYVKPDNATDLLIIKTTGKTKLKPGERFPSPLRASTCISSRPMGVEFPESIQLVAGAGW